jgi:glutamate carboxypeptidase
MNSHHAGILAWIDSQAAGLPGKLIDWANLNSGTSNLAGLEKFRAVLRRAFEPLGGEITEIGLEDVESIDSQGVLVRTPVGKALSVVKRPTAPVRVFLCIHMDTVYAADHPFQSCTWLDENTLQGPGVADAKGGLLVMLTALSALEQSPLCEKIGWEVLINPDEEIGSLSSLPLLNAAATRNQFGLLFEPATADGALVDRRKGSGGFTFVIHGRSAHAGRDFAKGRNAVVQAADLAVQLHHLNPEMGGMNGITLNVGKIEGGGPSNVVPDLAIVRFNVRTTKPEDEQRVTASLQELLADLNRRDGFSATLHGQFTSPPKIPDTRTITLMNLIEQCGHELNLNLQWRPSGGTCDGNKLAAAGLPNVDTLGPCGGNLHSPVEFVLVKSLAERAKLAASILVATVDGGIEAVRS